MGDPNASLPTPQPSHYRPMFGSFGRALEKSVTFRIEAALDDPGFKALSWHRRVEAISNTRSIRRGHDSQRRPSADRRRSGTYAVRRNGVL